jgi:HSP20 family protein
MFSLIPWRQKESSGGALQRSEHPLARMRDEFDSLFERFFNWPSADLRGGWGLDSEETDREYVFRLDAPGFETDDFDVQLSGNVLTVQAQRGQQEQGKDGGGSVQRRLQQSFPLPASADAQKAEARYRNGVLELRLPKTADAQARRIPVRGA